LLEMAKRGMIVVRQVLLPAADRDVALGKGLRVLVGTSMLIDHSRHRCCDKLEWEPVAEIWGIQRALTLIWDDARIVEHT